MSERIDEGFRVHDEAVNALLQIADGSRYNVQHFLEHDCGILPDRVQDIMTGVGEILREWGHGGGWFTRKSGNDKRVFSDDEARKVVERHGQLRLKQYGFPIDQLLADPAVVSLGLSAQARIRFQDQLTNLTGNYVCFYPADSHSLATAHLTLQHAKDQDGRRPITGKLTRPLGSGTRPLQIAGLLSGQSLCLLGFSESPGSFNFVPMMGSFRMTDGAAEWTGTVLSADASTQGAIVATDTLGGAEIPVRISGWDKWSEVEHAWARRLGYDDEKQRFVRR